MKSSSPIFRRIFLLLILTLVAWVSAGTAVAVDLDAERAAVRAADEALNRAVAEHDVERFKALIAEDATFLGGSTVRHGPEDVAQGWAPLLAVDRTTTLTWHPKTAEVAASGDLAYTIGDYELTSTGEDGAKSLSVGTYVTVWKKGPHGWQAVVDSGTPPKPRSAE